MQPDLKARIPAKIKTTFWNMLCIPRAFFFLVLSFAKIIQLSGDVQNPTATIYSNESVESKVFLNCSYPDTSKKTFKGQSKNKSSIKEPQLAIAMIFRDEAPYLKEWIEYHQMLGVERFYLYNHLSKDEYKQVLEPYIKNKVVILNKWNKSAFDGRDLGSWNMLQCLAYMNALAKARTDNVRWLAILDSDEFLVPRNTDSLIEFLAPYEDKVIGCLHINWVMFGTSYVKKIPLGQLLIETLMLNQGYVLCGAKTIVRPDRCNPYIMGGPHAQPMLANYESREIGFELIQCNHYWTRDEDYLNNKKIPRRITWNMPPEVCFQMNDAFNHENIASEPILRFIPKLRERMGFK